MGLGEDINPAALLVPSTAPTKAASASPLRNWRMRHREREEAAQAASTVKLLRAGQKRLATRPGPRCRRPREGVFRHWGKCATGVKARMRLRVSSEIPLPSAGSEPGGGGNIVHPAVVYATDGEDRGGAFSRERTASKPSVFQRLARYVQGEKLYRINRAQAAGGMP